MGQFSPRQVALISALLVAAVGCAVLVAIVDIFPDLQWPIRGALFFALLFLLAYAIFSFGISRFINNRINLLYRTVHDLRRTPKDKEHPILRGDVIGQVNTVVAELATERAAEIKDLQQREAFRREFIGNLAHELKTPIFNIQGYILTLLEGGLEDAKVNRDFLKRASNGVDRLMKIVEDLDLITKLESGVMDLRIARMDLNEVVSESIASMEILAKEKEVRLINELGPQVFVKADRNRMTQVFVNLFNNAIIYGKPGGTCTVRSFPLDDKVLIEVSDNGIGISEEHLPRLFERFYRVGKSRARNEGGSGLGLAIVKHIIDVHGGTMAVKSKEGEGTTFNFTLRKAP